ncbi:MAG: M50 family metallopeptidase [bacterium]
MPLKEKYYSRFEVITLSFILILFLFLWDTFLVFPIKLFTVILHEVSHGIAGILSGGQILMIQFDPNLGGMCIIEGGNEFIVASAGYIGSLILGSILFISSFKKYLSYWVCIGYGALLILITSNLLVGKFEIIMSLLFAVFLILSAKFLKWEIHSFIMKLIGLTSCIYVLFDIKDDLFASAERQTDAQLIFLLTGIPIFIWATLWLFIAALTIYLLLRKGYKSVTLPIE